MFEFKSSSHRVEFITWIDTFECISIFIYLIISIFSIILFIKMKKNKNKIWCEYLWTLNSEGTECKQDLNKISDYNLKCESSFNINEYIIETLKIYSWWLWVIW